MLWMFQQETIFSLPGKYWNKPESSCGVEKCKLRALQNTEYTAPEKTRCTRKKTAPEKTLHQKKTRCTRENTAPEKTLHQRKHTATTRERENSAMLQMSITEKGSLHSAELQHLTLGRSAEHKQCFNGSSHAVFFYLWCFININPCIGVYSTERVRTSY